MSNSYKALTKTTLLLHWLIAIVIITMIAVGIYMEENEAWDLYPIHKSTGIIIFIFILVRAFRRLKEGWLPSIVETSKIENLVSKTVLWVLILGSILFPISGILMSGAGGHGISVFGLDLLASNYNAAGEAIALNKDLAEIAHETHEILGTVMIVTIALHILASLKHHFIAKNAILKRIVGK